MNRPEEQILLLSFCVKSFYHQCKKKTQKIKSPNINITHTLTLTHAHISLYLPPFFGTLTSNERVL